MKTITHVYFEREERAVFKKVLTSINIGWPLEDRPERDRDDPVRRLGAIAKNGEATHRGVLVDALAVCVQQYAMCEAQSSEDYWHPFIARVRANHIGAGVPLIGDPDVAAKTLAAAREIQTREAAEAVKLLQKAIKLAPVDERELRYEDV